MNELATTVYTPWLEAVFLGIAECLNCTKSTTKKLKDVKTGNAVYLSIGNTEIRGHVVDVNKLDIVYAGSDKLVAIMDNTYVVGMYNAEFVVHEIITCTDTTEKSCNSTK